LSSVEIAVREASKQNSKPVVLEGFARQLKIKTQAPKYK
jgi:hypothetical protein